MSIEINGVKIEDLLKKGKELEDHSDEFEFLKKSYIGGKEYRDGSYIERHKREMKSSYKRRLKQSVYTNYVSPIIDIYNAYLHREKVSRENVGINNTLYDAYIEDADLDGRSHEKIMREVSRISALFGSVGILVDSPSVLSGNLGKDLLDNIHTFIKLYTPENIINMIFNYETGRPVLDVLVLNEDFDDSKFEYFIIYTKDEFFRFKKEERGNPILISNNTHYLKKIPFIFHKNKDSLLEEMGVSDVIDIAELNKRVYQLDSAAMEIIENTAFPFLEVPKIPNIGGDSGDVIVGTTNVLEFDPDSTDGRHKWVEPSGSSLQSILDWRNQALEDIRYHSKIGGSDSTKSKGQNSSGSASGVALELMFQQLNAVLSEKAEAMENTEKSIFSLIALWNNSVFSGDVEYSRRFGIRDLSFELDQIIKADSFLNSETFKIESAKKISSRMLGDRSTQETIKKIENEVGKTNISNSFDMQVLNNG